MGKFKLYALFCALVVSCMLSSAAYAGGDSIGSQSPSGHTFEPHFRDLSEKAGFKSLVIKMYGSDNKYFGYSQSHYFTKNNNLRLELLKIEPDYRNKGLGSFLFQHTIKELKAYFPDSSEVTWNITPLEVTKDDPSYPTVLESLKAFYKKQGALVMQSPWSKYPTGSFDLKKNEIK